MRKSRTPLKNLITQSISAPGDDSSLTDINLGSQDATAGVQPGRRCSLSRTSSNGSDSRNFAHFHHHHPHHSEMPDADDDDGSDETDPNSDNDLIVKSRDGSDGECKKK